MGLLLLLLMVFVIVWFGCCCAGAVAVSASRAFGQLARCCGPAEFEVEPERDGQHVCGVDDVDGLGGGELACLNWLGRGLN